MEFETLTRQHLHDLVWSTPMSKLALRYQITDSGLRKICTRLSVPLPVAGHWQKVRHGRMIPKPNLPDGYVGESEVRLELVSTENPKRKGVVSQVNAEVDSIAADLKRARKKRQSSAKTEPLVVATRAVHEASRKRKWDSPVFDRYPDRLDINVSDQRFEKALSFFDTLIKALKARGHGLGFNGRNTVAQLFGEEVEIRLREKNRMIRAVKDKWPTTTYEPTGVLYFGAKVFIHDRTWTDKNRSLEEQLPEIIAYLELKGKELVDDRRKSVLASERREKEKKQRLEFEQLRDAELAKFKSLLFSVSRWQQLRLIREYIDDVEAKGINSPEQSDWVAWARKKADWYDPHVNADDDLLHEVNRETLQPQRKL